MLSKHIIAVEIQYQEHRLRARLSGNNERFNRNSSAVHSDVSCIIAVATSNLEPECEQDSPDYV